MARSPSTRRRTAGLARAFRPPEGCDSILVTKRENVRYLTGFTGSAGCVLVTRRQKIFFTDFRYRQQAESQAGGYVVRVEPGTPALAAARHAVRRRMKLGVLGLENADLSHKQYADLRKLLKGVRFRDATGTVEALRAVKDSRETGLIRTAAAIADNALRRLRRTRVTGRTEAEVAWMLERWMREDGSEKLPFDVIVASGRRSAMPHGVATEKVIGRDELVVVDLGARVGGYCSDITRTYATGSLTGRQQDIYQVVSDAQLLALESMSPGVDCAAVDAAARELIANAGYGDDFGHALGHGVGLEPHEEPVLASRSRDRLAAGMVVTVEPGVYRQRIGGVRIEDTVLVTPLGHERLTRTGREMITLK